MHGWVFLVLMATAIAVRPQSTELSVAADPDEHVASEEDAHEDSSAVSSGAATSNTDSEHEDEEVDDWLAAQGVAQEGCGCGDTACVDSYGPSGGFVQITANKTTQQQKGARVAKSVITLYWVGQTLDYRNCFLRMWKAMPVSASTEFKVVGTKYDISKDLNERPDLTTASPSSYENKPINLCITRPMGTAAEEFRKAYAGNFAGIGGLGTLIAGSASIFGAGEAATAIHALASNPSDFNFDNAIDSIVENSKVATIKTYWSRLTGSKTIAWLTLGDCGRAPITVKFKVLKHGSRYSASWTNGNAVTAKELAALIVMSR